MSDDFFEDIRTRYKAIKREKTNKAVFYLAKYIAAGNVVTDDLLWSTCKTYALDCEYNPIQYLKYELKMNGIEL